MNRLSNKGKIKLKEKGVKRSMCQQFLPPIVGLLKTKHYRLKPNSDPTTRFCLMFVLFTFNLRNHRL